MGRDVLVGADLLAGGVTGAEEAGAVDEGVEATVRRGAGQPGDVVDQLDDGVPARPVDGHAVLDEPLVAGERGGGGGLADGGGAGGDLGLEGVDGPDQPGVARAVADAPA